MLYKRCVLCVRVVCMVFVCCLLHVGYCMMLFVSYVIDVVCSLLFVEC